MENLWWPGLNFRRPEMTYLLLESIHYQKKGLMLDTGHFLLTHPHILSDDPMEQMNQLFTHIFAIDKHQPFTAPGVRELVERIQPEYVTPEYITESREQLAEYLSQGMAALKNEKIFVNPLTNWE